MQKKSRSPLNRSITISKAEINSYSKRLIKLDAPVQAEQIINRTINQNLISMLDFLPHGFVDLMIIDPPYNLNKVFNSTKFRAQSVYDYSSWIENFIVKLIPVMKKNGSIYFCGDWYSSISVAHVLQKHFYIRNRITWEREKGRGSKTNWKNSSEDIWFCTLSNKYTFNSDAVKLNRRVIAPYKDENGNPKDWQSGTNGNFRETYSSNIWTDISVPFWSMPENTEHPTQKPEKLISKLLLASSNKGDVVLDPFLGSGTTSVAAKKLGRKFVGIESDKKYACLAEKRLELADADKRIQGYSDGIFWERNTLLYQTKK